MFGLISTYNKGEIDHADLVTSMNEQISKAEEEAFSRKSIMEKIEKWILACNEEQWLDDYSRVRFLSRLYTQLVKSNLNFNL